MLQEMGSQGCRTIALSANPDLIRRVAAAMSVEYRARLGAPGSASSIIDGARIKVLDSIASASITEEDEGESIARPVWWDTLSNDNEEVSQSQP